MYSCGDFVDEEDEGGVVVVIVVEGVASCQLDA